MVISGTNRPPSVPVVSRLSGELEMVAAVPLPGVLGGTVPVWSLT